MSTLPEMAHALRALDPPATQYGLSESNSSEGVYVRAMEDYGWAITFTYECGRNGVDITYAELVGRGSVIVVPLSFFESKDLDMVAEEIQYALKAKRVYEREEAR